jgi:MoaA/NifB/PqqE/SkfB family radical SAM enzyme
MYTVDEITHLHLEISSKCNAACPLCPRNFHGYPYNDGYIEHDMTLIEAKKIFNTKFIKQLKIVYINGNFGDMVMNPDTVSIIEYFKKSNDNLIIKISTNGGARDQKFWQALAKLDVIIHFCIDGLEDTHSLYRQNTLYSTVIKNAKIFIEAGGHAVWKMIKFDHNLSQHSSANDIAKKLGFKEFLLKNSERTTSPVFNKDKKLTHVIGKTEIVDFDYLYNLRTKVEVLLEDITPKKDVTIKCSVKEKKSVYVSSTGDMYPCCWTGFNPTEYGKGNWHACGNRQLAPLIRKNNALQYSMDECIKWFNQVEKSWELPTVEQGRLLFCNDICGVKN